MMMSTATLRMDDKQPFSDENDSDRLDWATHSLEGHEQRRKLARQHDNVGFEHLDDMIVQDSIHSLKRLSNMRGGSSPDDGKTNHHAPLFQDISNTPSHQPAHARKNGHALPGRPDHDAVSSSSERYMVSREARPEENIMLSEGTDEIASLQYAGGRSSAAMAGASGLSAPTMFLSEASSCGADDHTINDSEIVMQSLPKSKVRVMGDTGVANGNTLHAAHHHHHHQDSLSEKTKTAVMQASGKRKNSEKITKKKAGSLMAAAAELAGIRLGDATDGGKTPTKKKHGQKGTLLDDERIAQARQVLLQDSQSFSDIDKGTGMSPVDDACGDVLLARHENVCRKIKKADVLMSSSQESGVLETGIVLARDEPVEDGIFAPRAELSKKNKKKVSKALLSEHMGAVKEALIEKKERKPGKKPQALGQQIGMELLQETAFQEDPLMMTLAAQDELSMGDEADERETDKHTRANYRVEPVATTSVSGRKSKPKVKTKNRDTADMCAEGIAMGAGGMAASLPSVKAKAGKAPRKGKTTQTKVECEDRVESLQEELKYDEKSADVAVTSGSSKVRAKGGAAKDNLRAQEQDANSNMTQITGNTKAKVKSKRAVEKARAKDDDTEPGSESAKQKPVKKPKSKANTEERKAGNMTNVECETGLKTPLGKPRTRKGKLSRNSKRLALLAAANSTLSKPLHVCNETCSALPLDIAPPGRITVNGEETVGFRLMVVGDPVALKRPRHVFGGHTYDPNYRDKKVCARISPVSR
jgi:hypothetical protein